MTERFVLEGAKELRKHIKERGLSVPSFCELHGLDRIQVQRAMNGERQKISVEFAQDIEKATDGAVKWDSWVPPKKVRRSRRERRSALRRHEAA